MLEEFVSRLLAKLLGEYVEGINTNALQVSLISGQVEINNIRLKASALKQFRLNVKVKEGFIGKLLLTIPWTALHCSSVIVEISQLFLLLEPNTDLNDEEFDIEKEFQKMKQEKLGFADSKAEEFLKDKEEGESFFSKMMQTILNNIQMEIRDVHIRYEDTVTASLPFYCGLTIESVSAHSTDDDWNEIFVDSSSAEKVVHKYFELKSFAIYWNKGEHGVLLDSPLTFDSTADLSQKMQELIYSKSNSNFPKHQYLLQPIVASLKLRINNEKKQIDDTDLFSIPDYTLEFMFGQVNFSLGSAFSSFFYNF